MSAFLIGIITVCMLIAGLDGFDVLVVAFPATALVEQWMLSPSALGLVLSADPVGDRLGRRPAVLICLVGLASGPSAGVFAAC